MINTNEIAFINAIVGLPTATQFNPIIPVGGNSVSAVSATFGMSNPDDNFVKKDPDDVPDDPETNDDAKFPRELILPQTL